MVLVFAESPRGQIKKSAFEAVTYGKKTADLLGVACVALTVGKAVQRDSAELGRYGASKVLSTPSLMLPLINSIARRMLLRSPKSPKTNGATVVILSHTVYRQISSLAGLAIRLDAGLVSGAKRASNLWQMVAQIAC
jgi:electron transfer flavoprotein alpha subunit